MLSGHLIDELRFELAWPDEQSALDGQPRWESLWRTRLAAAAQSVFDAAGRPGEVWRYQRIEVDMGVLPPGTSAAETEQRFRERLREALENARLGTTAAAEPAAGVPRARADVELLQSFLLTGRLPWHAGAQTRTDPADLLAGLAPASFQRFVRWLRGVPLGAPALRRLAAQGMPEGLDAIAAALMPSHAALLPLLRRRMEAVFAEAAGGHEGAPRAWAVREALLATALASGGSVDAAALARAVIARAARIAGGSQGDAAALVREVAARYRQAGTPVGAGVTDPSLPAAPEGSPGGNGRPGLGPAAVPRFERPPGELDEGAAGAWPERHEVERVLLGLDGVASPARWRVLVQGHGALVEGAVRHHGRLARVRRRLAETFSEGMLQEVVMLLEPTEARFVAEVVRGAEVFRPARAPVVASPEALRRRTWEFTLGYLLVERGSQFNRQSYLGSLVRQMAARDNLDEGELLAGMLEALEAPGARTVLQEELVLLLRALWREAGARQAPHMPDARTLDAHGAVAAALLHEPGAARGSTLAGAITALAAQQPHAFESLLRRLRAQPPAALLERLDEAALEALVLAWAAHGQGPASPFAAAIAAAARRVPRRRVFLAQVLHRLLRNETVDVEALAVQAGSIPPPADAHATVHAWLARGYVEDGVDTWTALVDSQPRALHEALKSAASRSGGARALAQLFSAPMLGDIVRLVQPGASAFVLSGVAALQRMIVSTGVGHGPRGPDRAAWEFTLAWLLGERGTAFNRHAWLAALVRQMAARRNLRVDVLIEALMAEIAAQARPGGPHAGLLALLQALHAGEAPRRPRATGGAAGVRGREERRPAPKRLLRSRACADDPVRHLVRRLRGFDAAVPLPPVSVLARALARAAVPALQALAHALEERPDAMARLMAWLPEPVIEALLPRLRPAAATAMLACVDVVAAAGRDTAVRLQEAQWSRLRLDFALRWLVAEGRGAQPAAVARAFAALLETHVPADARDAWRARLRDRLADDRSHDQERLRAIADALSDDDGGGADPAPPRASIAHALPSPGEVLHVANAGMVLAAPYLPRLFGMVGLLEEGRFRDEAAAARAVHLLQYLVDGSTQSPEPVLLLNKILCGVPLDTPVPRDVALTEAECTAVEGLLGGIIANWTALGRTSVAGLRETFLQREGRLTLKDDAWHLLVEPRAFDMLLDRLPWSIATLRLAWMDRVLHVEWR